jgi:hypothetical protein
MWYKHLRDFLLHHQFQHDQTLPCLFTLKDKTGFVIIAVYVDDLNLVGTPDTCSRAMSLLTIQFEMKLLGDTTLCSGLQVVHLPYKSIFLHQTTYTQNILKMFLMNQAKPLSALMVGQSKTFDDPYRPCEEEEFYDKNKYLAAVGALLYLSIYTRPHIYFATSVLARHSQRPRVRHWNGVKHLFRYLRGTEDLGLHYTEEGASKIIGYAEASFKSDENFERS